MPNWVNTPEEDKAWKKAERIVARQRKKSVSAFTDSDLRLVSSVAKNILRSSLSNERGVIYALAKVEHLLDKRSKVEAKKKGDDKLPEDAKLVVEALKKVMSKGGQSIAALRKAQTTKMEKDEAAAFAEELTDIANRLADLLDSVKG